MKPSFLPKRISALYRRCLSRAGRNNTGRITVRHRGGGGSKHPARLNLRRRLYRMLGRVLAVYPASSVHSARIALVSYPQSALYEHVLCPHNVTPSARLLALQSGDVTSRGTVWFRFRAFAQAVGTAFPLQVLKAGQSVFNVERRPGQGGRLARAAGCFLEVVQKLQVGQTLYAVLRNRSGRLFYLLGLCMAVLGQSSNPHQARQPYGKAGTRRGLGWRPAVRGVAMNPVDHPHGGGEGKTSGGRSAVSPWGRLTKGKRTLAPWLRLRRARALVRMRLGGKRGSAMLLKAGG
jgi:large subunit ribosomal protein L2